MNKEMDPVLIEAERVEIDLEERRLNLEQIRFCLEREKISLGQEKTFFKRELIECARRNCEVIIALEKSGLVDAEEARKQVRDYLEVMRNAIYLNKWLVE